MAAQRIGGKAGQVLAKPEQELSPALSNIVSSGDSLGLSGYLEAMSAQTRRFYAAIVKYALLLNQNGIIDTVLKGIEADGLKDNAREICDLALEKDHAKLFVRLMAFAYLTQEVSFENQARV